MQKNLYFHLSMIKIKIAEIKISMHLYVKLIIILNSFFLIFLFEKKFFGGPKSFVLYQPLDGIRSISF